MMLKFSNKTYRLRDIHKAGIIFSFKFIIFVKLWYSFTMKLTKLKGKRVRKYDFVNEIPPSYGYGSRYRKDPLNGKLDYLTHPSRLARNVEEELPFGDCDDHAIYWCVALLKSGLADRAWFSFYQMEKQDGSFSGHAVCVFELDGSYFWCDYFLPAYLGEYRDKWIYKTAKTYDATPLMGAMIEIESIDEDDTPVFGKITILEPTML